MQVKHLLSTLTLSTLLVACGGGGGSGSTSLTHNDSVNENTGSSSSALGTLKIDKLHHALKYKDDKKADFLTNHFNEDSLTHTLQWDNQYTLFDSSNQLLQTDTFLDAGLVAAEQNLGSQFGGVRALYNETADGMTSVYLRDPSKTGFKYQTFGPVVEQNRVIGNVSIGNHITPPLTADINASYKGFAIGQIRSVVPEPDPIDAQVIADVTANLKFSDADRSLKLQVTNSQVMTTTGEGSTFNTAPSLDFSETLIYMSQGKFASFSADDHDTTAVLYGPQAEEIGGTFGHDAEYNGEKVFFSGAYGTKKQ